MIYDTFWRPATCAAKSGAAATATSAPSEESEVPLNTRHCPNDQAEYAKLAYVPLGLLVLAALMRTDVAAAGPSMTALALDLLALAQAALVGWLGSGFMLAHPMPIGRRRSRRHPPRRHLTHKTI